MQRIGLVVAFALGLLAALAAEAQRAGTLDRVESLMRGGVDMGRWMIQASGALLLVVVVALGLVAWSWWTRRP
jgi:hypothetical protein